MSVACCSSTSSYRRASPAQYLKRGRRKSAGNSAHSTTHPVRLTALSDCASTTKEIFNHVVMTRCVVTHIVCAIYILTAERLVRTFESFVHNEAELFVKPDLFIATSSTLTAQHNPAQWRRTIALLVARRIPSVFTVSRPSVLSEPKHRSDILFGYSDIHSGPCGIRPGSYARVWRGARAEPQRRQESVRGHEDEPEFRQGARVPCAQRLVRGRLPLGGKGWAEEQRNQIKCT